MGNEKQTAASSRSLPRRVRRSIGYRFARWWLNRWLRQNPERVVALIEDLHAFADIHLPEKEYQECVARWKTARAQTQPNSVIETKTRHVDHR